jgi:hypothetical protein
MEELQVAADSLEKGDDVSLGKQGKQDCKADESDTVHLMRGGVER